MSLIRIYTNLFPYLVSRKLNWYVLPEMGFQAFSALLLLLSGAWITFLLNVPMLAWNAKMIMSNTHMHDSTTIFKDVSSRQKRSFFKLACFAVFFFVYLFLFVSRLVDE